MGDNSANKSLSIINAVLESGNSVELPASGYSMFPGLRPGDIVTVKPLYPEQILSPGSIIVYKTTGGFVMHRLIKIVTAPEGEIRFVTRGDSLRQADPPFGREQITGIAVCFRRNEDVQNISGYIPCSLRYTFNRFILWCFIVSKRMIRA